LAAWKPFKYMATFSTGAFACIRFARFRGQRRSAPDGARGCASRLPLSGPSGTCTFDLTLRGTEVSKLNARITVLHENRVLQTAILRAPIGDSAAER